MRATPPLLRRYQLPSSRDRTAEKRARCKGPPPAGEGRKLCGPGEHFNCARIPGDTGRGTNTVLTLEAEEGPISSTKRHHPGTSVAI